MVQENRRIAVLIDTFDEYCQNHILEGLYRAGEEASFTLVTFPALSLTTVESHVTHYKLFQESINAKNFDGMIIFTGALTEHTSIEKLKAIFPPFLWPVLAGTVRKF